MKILHVADYVMPAIGYQEYLLPKWNAIHGHETYILCSDRYIEIPNYEENWQPILGDRICGPEKLKIEGINIERLPSYELKSRVWLRNLRKKIEQIDPDVIWGHGTASFTSFRLARLSRKLKKPLILDNHQCFISARSGVIGKIYYTILKYVSVLYLNKNVDRFIGVAEECCNFMVQKQGIKRDKIELVNLGVDTEIFKPDAIQKQKTRKKLAIPEDAVVVMQTGKLDHDRRPDWLVKAMTKLMSEDEKLWLLFVGGFPDGYKAEIQNYLSKHGMLNRTVFYPFVPQWELPAYFNAADICVYPGFSSLSCLEAGACGCAVIVNDLPASKERADAGIGLSYQNGNIENLQFNLRKLIEDSELRKETGMIAREYVIKKASYDLIAYESEKKMGELANTNKHN